MDDIRRPQTGGSALPVRKAGSALPERVRASRSATARRALISWKRAVPLIAMVGIAAIASAAFLAPQFHVQRIRVEGGNGLLRTETESHARAFVERTAVFAGAPRLFLVARDRLAQSLRDELPELATVQILRRLPGTLELYVQEKVAVAFLETDGRMFSLGNDGRVITEVSPEDARRAQLPKVRDVHTASAVRPGDVVLNPSVLQLLHEVIVKLPEQFSVSVDALIIPAIGSEEIHVQTSGSWSVLFDARRPLAEQLAALEKVVTEELNAATLQRLEYIDLRIPGRVFYRIK
ncbi:MAG: hypothetical protein G01um1014106_319 [Parcubacteria group bacterium Gr01-1014_106]|nr:MAG: hypothetical protein G01um1014106_319 [Parcubacteria group bacterium Gr01-1014_106]